MSSSAVKVPLASTSPVIVVVRVGLRALPAHLDRPAGRDGDGHRAFDRRRGVELRAGVEQRERRRIGGAERRLPGVGPDRPEILGAEPRSRRRRARRGPDAAPPPTAGWADAGAGPATTAAARAAAVTARLIAAVTSMATSVVAPPGCTTTTFEANATVKLTSTRAGARKLSTSASSSGSTRRTCGPADSPAIANEPSAVERVAGDDLLRLEIEGDDVGAVDALAALGHAALDAALVGRCHPVEIEHAGDVVGLQHAVGDRAGRHRDRKHHRPRREHPASVAAQLGLADCRVAEPEHVADLVHRHRLQVDAAGLAGRGRRPLESAC